MSFRVVGLDPSLAQFGLAVDGDVQTWKPPRGEDRGVERLAWFYDQLTHLCTAHEPSLAMVEGYSYASKASREVLGELGGIVRLVLYQNGIPFVVVAPKSVKKFTTDNGNAGKDEMVISAVKKWGFEGKTNNEADAWMLHLMGRFQFEGELAVGIDLPLYARKVLAGIEWPELVPV